MVSALLSTTATLRRLLACATLVGRSSTNELFGATLTSGTRKVGSSDVVRAADRYVYPLIYHHHKPQQTDNVYFQVRDEHRTDYDAGRGGWGAQAQRAEMERRRAQEERYADAQDGPGAVATGGGDWKASAAAPEQQTLKRGRSPEEEDESRTVRFSVVFLL